jgi:tetratricopeptide (TPR) repeat protein
MYFYLGYKKRISEKLLQLLLVAVMLGVFGGCSGFDAVRKYRQAQHYFSEAAQLENGIKLRGAFQGIKPDEDTNLVSVAPEITNANKLKADYQEALALLQSIDTAGESELEEQNMLMDKLTLEALCLLRLKRYDEIEPVLNRAGKLSDKQITIAGRSRSRDSYMLQALPGLIMNDQAYAKIPQNITSNTALFEEIEKMIIGPGAHALKYINASRRAATKNSHPVQLYLLQAELAAYRNLMGAYTYCQPNRTSKPNKWNQSAQHKQALPLLKCLEKLDQTPEKVVFNLWWNSFGQPIMGDEVICDMGN